MKDTRSFHQGGRSADSSNNVNYQKVTSVKNSLLVSSLSFPLPSICRYTFLQGKGYCSLQNFRVSPFGRFTTHIILAFLETIQVAPKGSTKVHTVLQTAAWALIAAGKLDIFTPTFRIVARKPL